MLLHDILNRNTGKQALYTKILLCHSEKKRDLEREIEVPVHDTKIQSFDSGRLPPVAAHPDSMQRPG